MNRLITVQNAIQQLLCQKETVIVAIDGNCTSGKTTLANQLAANYDCNIFHMDDFFLRPEHFHVAGKLCRFLLSLLQNLERKRRRPCREIICA